MVWCYPIILLLGHPTTKNRLALAYSTDSNPRQHFPSYNRMNQNKLLEKGRKMHLCNSLFFREFKAFCLFLNDLVNKISLDTKWEVVRRSPFSIASVLNRSWWYIMVYQPPYWARKISSNGSIHLISFLWKIRRNFSCILLFTLVNPELLPYRHSCDYVYI